MLPERRREFNERFTPEKYREFLRLADSRCGAHIKFRLCETPCFFPAELIETMARAGAEMVEQLVADSAYLSEARRRIPPDFLARNETPRPLFVQADFGIVRDAAGNYAPRLVEIQGFPSLYGLQPVLADCYREAYGLDGGIASLLGGRTRDQYEELFRRSVLGEHSPEDVVLLEIDPLNQKTWPDFVMTQRICGIRIVDIRDVRREGRQLYVGGRRIRRIYNRVIADEFVRRNIEPAFRFSDDLDIEWAGHPNWFFLISKFSIPYLRHETVPASWFLDQITKVSRDLSEYVLKPLYSFAGTGVKVGPTREDIDSIPPESRRDYLLQERIRFEPVIETPFGPTQAEVRIMYIWDGRLEPVTTIVRMGRGRMMGVDHNRDLEWVGASAGFMPERKQ